MITSQDFPQLFLLDFFRGTWFTWTGMADLSKGDRRAQILFSSYWVSEGICLSPKGQALTPSEGAIYTKVSIEATALLCLNLPEFSQTHLVGSLNDSSYNFTITIHTNNWTFSLKPLLILSLLSSLTNVSKIQWLNCA